jgi:hypothetical protein
MKSKKTLKQDEHDFFRMNRIKTWLASNVDGHVNPVENHVHPVWSTMPQC